MNHILVILFAVPPDVQTSLNYLWYWKKNMLFVRRDLTVFHEKLSNNNDSENEECHLFFFF